MPIRIEITAGGTAYVDIRVGEGHGIHQRLLDGAALAAFRDADGNIPPGLGITAAGGPAHAAATTPVAFVGPGPAWVPATGTVYGNTFESGVLNAQAIRDNVGTAFGGTAPAGIRVI